MSKPRLSRVAREVLIHDYEKHACIPLLHEAFGGNKRIHIIFGATSNGAIVASSMGAQFQSVPVIKIDSDTIRIAFEEGLSGTFIKRAREIFKLLTDSR